MSYQIKLAKLHVNGFRVFENDVALTFDPQLTVLIGNNGSGKSAILDAIAIGLMYLRNEITGGKMFEFPVPLDPIKKRNYDVNNSKSEFENALELKFTQTEKEKDGTIVLTYNKLVDTSLIIRGTKTSTNDVERFGLPEDAPNIPKEDQLGEALNLFTQHIYNAKLQQTLNNIPVLAYYGCNSINTDTTRATIDGTAKVTDLDMFDTYRQSLEAKEFNFEQLLLLLDRRQKSMLQERRNEDRFLDALQTAIGTMLNNDAQTNYNNLRINYGLLFDETMIDKTNNGKTEILYLNQLSSGEKFLLGLIADLVRRLYLANPEGNLLEGQGIVLIDEVDLHLHPSWQQKVVTKLLKNFPNCQFVVTTHSPMVLSNIYSKHIRAIENGTVYSVSDTFGHDDADDMLRIMGVESENQKKIKAIHLLLRVDKIDEAKAIRQTIVTEGAFTPLLEIDLFIKRKEKQVHEAHK